MQSSRKPVEQKSFVGETVEVTRAVEASVEKVWQALTDRDVVEKWFGTLTSPLVEGQPTTLEFGDGDLFLIDTLRVDPPARLQYAWRFLGVGPLDTITWTITPQKTGCLVTVEDSEPGRAEEDAAILRKGWLDFTERLEEFLRKGKPTRYPWRHEFDGSVELPVGVETAWRKLFDPGAQAKWLPFNQTFFHEGAPFTIVDGLKPFAFEMVNLELQPPDGVRFEVISKEWLHPTTCALNLSPRGQGSLLSVSHNGWEAISPKKAYQKEQRKRFCAIWIDTLRRIQKASRRV